MKLPSSIDDISSIDINTKDSPIKANVQNNSTTNILSIGFILDFKGTISLFDMSGKQVFSTKADADSGSYVQIETDSFSSGIYLLNLQNEQNSIVTEKIMIK